MMSYASDLSDKEWAIVEEMLPKKKKTRPMNWPKQVIMNAVMYQLKNGCNWHDVPKDFPPYSTVFWHYKQGRSSGILGKILEKLHEQLRLKKTESHTPLC